MKDLTIRKAIASDLPAIYNLVYELAVYEKEPHALTATLADYEQNFQNGIFEAHVVQLGDIIIGMGLYYLTYSTWKGRMLYLEDFIITEHHRRRGYGQLLFEAIVQEARKKAAVLLKWQVLDWNIPAIKFYKKNRAIIEKDWWNGKIEVTG